MENLINLLAVRYPTEGDARRVAENAELPSQHITFIGTAYNMWMSLLRVARLVGKIDNVIKVAINDFNPNYFKNNHEDWYSNDTSFEEKLKKAKQMDDYNHWYENGEEFENRLREAEKHYLAASTKAGFDKVKLRNRKSDLDLPTDYKSILFTNPHKLDENSAPLADIIRGFNGTEVARFSCIIAHYQQDVELSLMEAAEIVAFDDSVNLEKHDSIWIRGDELWSSPVIAPKELLREDWAVLLQLRPREADVALEQFSDRFDQMLDDLNLLFVLDFSRLTSHDLKRVDTSNQTSRRTDIINGIVTFSRYVFAKGHRIVIGLPRIALGLEDWRDFVESISDTFFASDLYSSLPAVTPTDSLAQSLPPLLSEAFKPLLEPNSYALTKKIKQEVEGLTKKSGIHSASKEQQLKEGLSVASRLANEGFLEPAYRLEVWFKMSFVDLDFVQLRADIIPNPNDKEKVFGQLEQLGDLPKVADRVIITGASGQGKTVALQSIEKHWCLPQHRSEGRKHLVWLPIYINDLQNPSLQIAEYFQQEANISVPHKGINLRLSAHLQLARSVSEDNLSWIFGSPVLYLIDGVEDTREESQVADWFNRLFNTNYISVGIISTFRDVKEVLPYINYIIEARLRPLDLIEAKKLSPNSHKQYVEQLFSLIEEPLNLHVRNLFLLQCICTVRKIEFIPKGCSLFELLRLYVKSKCELLPPAQVTELVEHQLPSFAYALYCGNNVDLPQDFSNLGVRYGLLSGKNKKFEHPLLLDFFLAKFVTTKWQEVKESFWQTMNKAEPEIWRSHYIHLFKMMMKALKPEDRESLVTSLSGFHQDQLAHLCLLELQTNEYEQIPIAKEICTRLITTIEATNKLTISNSMENIEEKKRIADALGYYDSRVPTLKDIRSALVPVYTNHNDENLFVGKFLVSNLEFSRFIRDGGYNKEEYWHLIGWEWKKNNNIFSPAYWTNFILSRSNFPVVGVSFYEALAYTNWLNEKVNDYTTERLKFSLPTEIEWSLLAGLGDFQLHKNHESRDQQFSSDDVDIKDKKIYEQILHILEENRASYKTNEVTPIGLFKPNSKGVYDLLGNVWQWCDEYYPLTSELPSINQHVSIPVLVRGGSVSGRIGNAAALLGGALDPVSRVNNVGFRLICRYKSL